MDSTSTPGGRRSYAAGPFGIDAATVEEHLQLIEAIRNYEVDALVVSGPDGELVVTLERALAHTQELLRRTREILHAAFDQALVGVLLIDRRGIIVENNAAADRLAGASGSRALLDQRMIDLVDPEDVEGVAACLEAVCDGRSACFEKEFRLRRADGEECWVNGSACVVRHREEPDGTLVLLQDITARRRAEERKAMLVAELNHRVMNTMATIEAMAVKAMRRCASIEEFGEAFIGRLRALRDAHRMLSGNAVVDTDLRNLIETVLAPHAAGTGDRVTVEGPNVSLRSRTAIVLSLTLHELATNAVKYGALGRPDAHLSISWTYRPENGRLAMAWREDFPTSPAPVAGSIAGGFGHDFIRMSIGYELDGDVDFRLDAQGFLATIALPLRATHAET